MNTTRELRLAVAGLLGLLSSGCALDELDHAIDDAATTQPGDSDGTMQEQDFAASVATAYCAALFACDPLNTCEAGSPYDSEASCIAAEQALAQEAQASAQAAGLAFDAGCVDEILFNLGELGCVGWEVVTQRDSRRLYPERWHCPPYHGDIAQGEGPCPEVVGTNYSECGSHLGCNDDVCRPLGEFPCECAEGEECIPDVGPSLCFPIVGLGETCISAVDGRVASCGPTAYCGFPIPDDATAVCITRGELGGACEYADACLSGACSDGACTLASPELCTDSAAPRRWR